MRRRAITSDSERANTRPLYTCQTVQWLNCTNTDYQEKRRRAMQNIIVAPPPPPPPNTFSSHRILNTGKPDFAALNQSNYSDAVQWFSS